MNRSTFKFPTPENLMPFDGKRFTTGTEGQIEREHYHRYLFATRYCVGKQVLDVASGEGYGSYLLAQVATSVIGIDIDKKAVDFANKNYLSDRLSFRKAKASQLPIEDGSIDVVVSFQTIEHLSEQKEFISEISRVLRPDGLLIMSSPDREIYSEAVYEFNRPECVGLLSAHFREIQLYQQSATWGSVIFPVGSGPRQEIEGFSTNDGRLFERYKGVPDAPYYIVVASTQPMGLAIPSILNSIFYAHQEERKQHLLENQKGIILEGLNDYKREEQKYLQEVTTQYENDKSRLEQAIGIAEAEALAVQHVVIRQRAAAHALQWLANNPKALKRSGSRKKAFWRRSDPVISATIIKKIEESQLFDADFYLANNQDVAGSGVSPLMHYLTYGWREGRKPNRVFDPMWYLAMNADVLRDGFEPLSHFVLHGHKEGRLFHPLFDEVYYYSTHSDLRATNISPLAHFVRYGLSEGRIPSLIIAELLQKARLQQQTAVRRLLLVAFGELAPAGAAGYYLAAKQFPPASLDDFHMSQALRDHLIERHDWKGLDLCNYLLSVINHYASRGTEFDVSEECKFLLNIAKVRSKCLWSDKPIVSIVIAAYNNLVYTLTSVISILKNDSNASYEIIIADDCSKDATQQIMESIGGVVRVVSTPNNIGFLRNCNHAAQSARGKYIMMLNNDTLVLPGWLDPLVDTLAHDSNIGLVGSKLLFANGLLQEAGAILWSNGSAWNFGRDQNPRLPQFNYVKDADYISGATIMLPADLWQRLGGFDEHYAPAYCEDVDIAFRVRAAGYRTVYQPFSEVIHHEGCSHGTDITKGVKANQVKNLKKFFDRWRTTLEMEHFPNGKNVFLARDRSRHKPHIVIVDHYVPQWEKDTGSRTIFHYIRLFLESDFHVSLWPDNLNYDTQYTPLLQRMGVEVLYRHDYVGSFADWLEPNAHHIDYVLLSRPHIAVNYIDVLKKYKNIRTLYYGHDLHFRRMLMQHQVTKDPELLSAARSMEATEKRVCRFANIVLCPSEEETNEVSTWLSKNSKAVTIPLIVYSEQELAPGFERARGVASTNLCELLFVAGFSHAPNKDGITWFVREVMPCILPSIPDVKLSIVGSNVDCDILSLQSDNVDVLGHVSDEKLDQLYKESGISIAPLRYGAGVKGKVIEAMAKGVPVVMTSVGAQGFVNPTAISLIADDAKGFAQAVITTIRNPDAATHRAIAAVKFIENNYSKTAARRILAPHMRELTQETGDNRAFTAA